jgi:AcrR family transcriptional regulator
MSLCYCCLKINKMTVSTAVKRTPRKRRAAEETPAEPVRRDLRAQGQRTRNLIVKAARKLLLEGGSLEFTLREVALRAEISISNLQYYFPTRLSVLRAVVEPVVEAYLADLRDAIRKGDVPRETLTGLVARAIIDAKDVESSALWCHFASLAAVDPECSRLLDEWYETLTNEIGSLFHKINPAFKMSDCLQKATLLIAMADGIAFQAGAGRRQRDYLRHLDAQLLSLIECMLR